MSYLPLTARRDEIIRSTIMTENRKPTVQEKHLYDNHPQYLFVGEENFYHYFQTCGGITACRLCKKIIVGLRLQR